MGGPRIVVIGAGAVGLSTALSAAQLGAKSVMVIEREHLASGSSGLSAGIFNRQTADPVDRAMRAHSVEVFAGLSDLGVLHLARHGYLRLAKTADQVAAIHSTIASLSTNGGISRYVTPQEIADLVPGIETADLKGGMFGPSDGSLDGPQLCQAYLGQGRSLGVQYQANCSLLGAEFKAGHIRLATANGDIECDLVINAAGPWLEPVGALLGVVSPTENQRHQVAILHVPSLAQRGVPIVQSYFPGSGEDGVYVRPDGNGRFITGMHSYEKQSTSVAADGYKKSLDAAYLETVAEALSHRFPKWDNARLSEGWTGLYPLSPDGQFIVGPHTSEPRVITVGGLGGVGLTVSPAVGRIAAEWATSGQSTTFGFADELLPERPSLGKRT
ncbi:MAG: FAD-dependent oxidoreductase [Actinomycetes bacterium]